MKILFATDSSDAATNAVEFASSLPFQNQPSLTLVSVVSDRDVPSQLSMHPGWARVVDSMVRGAEAETAKTAESLRDRGFPVENKVRKGHTADEILSEAESSDADMIVVGAIGHSALTRMFLGSVSDRIATHAECSVLVGRPTAKSSDHVRIQVAYDGSEKAEAALKQLTGMLKPAGCQIELVAALVDVGGIAIEFAEAEATAMEEARKALAGILEARTAALKADGYEASHAIIDATHVGHALCDHAEKAGADILVVGDHGFDAVQRFVLGSVSKYVLRHAKCSVLISRA